MPRQSCDFVSLLPVWHGNTFVGELDIDSHTLNPFSADDQLFCEAVTRVVSELVGVLAEGQAQAG